MSDLKPFWDRIAVALPRVLEVWSVEIIAQSVYVTRSELVMAECDLRVPSRNREAAMRVMDELEARGLAYFDSEVNLMARLTSVHRADGSALVHSGWYPIEDLAAPYVECLMLTLEALANE